MTADQSSRPTHWTFASPDLNVLLTGSLLDSNDDAPLQDGARFQLAATGGIYIQHPSLTSITSSPTSQSLVCLNTGLPIFSLEIPILPPPTEQDDQDSLSPSPPPPPTPTIITLHPPLLPYSPSLSDSSLFSPTFHILLDGPGFLPPSFDPEAIPGTPTLGPHAILNSPNLQRVLLSPLLSPQRRAHSTGSDASVPPLNLGVSRARATSISAGGGVHNNSLVAPGTRRSASRSRSRATSISIEALLAPPALGDQDEPAPPPPNLTLASVLTSDVSTKAKQTAEEIMALRRAHDIYIKRAKHELEVLSSRLSNASVTSAQVGGNGVVVKGFGVPPRARSASRERSVERSQERGRSMRGSNGKRNEEAGRDEDVSDKIRAEDERDEERGRSRSRVRRGAGADERAKANAAVAAVVAAANNVGGTSGSNDAKGSPNVLSPRGGVKSLPMVGQEISATIAEEGEEDEEHYQEEEESEVRGGGLSVSNGTTNGAGSASPAFVPSSVHLVSIPEAEELSLPPSETSKPTAEAEAAQDDSDEEEHDAPFEMDEDLDVDDLDLDDAPVASSDYDAGVAASPKIVASSYRAPSSSFRPSNTLSTSYATLLSSSLASRPAAPALSSSYTSSIGFKPSRLTQKASAAPAVASSSRASPHGMSTSAREDAHVRLDYVNQPDPLAARKGERALRDVLALDAPSHRQLVPSRSTRRRPTANNDDNDDDDPPSSDDDETNNSRAPPPAFAVGSLPIQIGMGRPPKMSSSFRPDGERELQRKTSVPSREHMFVPPALSRTKKHVGIVEPEQKTATTAVPMEIGSSTGGGNGGNATSSGGGGGGGLARSLRTFSGAQVGFARVAEEEDEAEELLLVDDGDERGGRDEDEDEDDDFVPPHELTRRARTDEDFLSTSVQR